MVKEFAIGLVTGLVIAFGAAMVAFAVYADGVCR